jgi:hypothetical protein
MVDADFFSGVVIFRVAKDFVAQFANSANKEAHDRFSATHAGNDHPATEPPFTYGTIFFAGGRSTDLCFGFCGKRPGETCRPGLGSAGWDTPIGHVVLEGDSGTTLKKIEAGGYGDMPPWGKGPDSWKISSDKTR